MVRDKSVCRARDTGVVCPHQHFQPLADFLLRPVDDPGEVRSHVGVEIGEILPGGNDAVGFDDPALAIVLVVVIEDAAGDFDGPHTPPRSRFHRGHELAIAGVEQLIDDPD